VSCPDWKRLARDRESVAHAFASSAQEAAGGGEWQDALAHLDSGCPACRRAALAADPLLVFRRLPVLEMSEEREEREVSDMQRAVAAMRTASRLETPSRSAVNWRRWAAAAGLTLLSLSAGPWRAPAARPAARTSLAQGASAASPVVAAEETNVVEAVENRPDARVYQMESNGFTLAMIVDESLEL